MAPPIVWGSFPLQLAQPRQCPTCASNPSPQEAGAGGSLWVPSLLTSPEAHLLGNSRVCQIDSTNHGILSQNTQISNNTHTHTHTMHDDNASFFTCILECFFFSFHLFELFMMVILKWTPSREFSTVPVCSCQHFAYLVSGPSPLS